MDISREDFPKEIRRAISPETILAAQKEKHGESPHMLLLSESEMHYMNLVRSLAHISKAQNPEYMFHALIDLIAVPPPENGSTLIADLSAEFEKCYRGESFDLVFLLNQVIAGWESCTDIASTEYRRESMAEAATQRKSNKNV